MKPGPKDILFGVVATAAGVGVLLALNKLLGEELLGYVLLAAALGIMVYLIAFLSASKRNRKEKEKTE